MSDDLPAPLDTEIVEDPENCEWHPMTGPFWWEKRLESAECTWIVGTEKYTGMGIRDTENPETEFICSSMFISTTAVR